MIPFALLRRRAGTAIAALRPEALVLGAAGFAAVATSLVSSVAPARETVSATPQVNITPAKAQALVAATRAPTPADLRAVGEEAKLINAALPFSSAPIEAARPFSVKDGGTDYARALLCMTQAVYYEAGFEPMEGRRAVAQVVLNRMRHPAFPKSVCGVVYQGASSPVCQFTFVCDGSLYRPPALAAWRQAAEIARAALAGHVERSVGEATHYHADYVAPRWAPLLTKISQHGAHIFYRWPGAWGLRAAFTGRYIGEPQDPLALRPPPPSPIDEQMTPEELAATQGAPAVPRAPNDVGGLLDTTKGWTLNIPAPEDTAASVAIAHQEGGTGAPPTAAHEVSDAGTAPGQGAAQE